MSRDSYASHRESVSARDSHRVSTQRDSVTMPRPKSSVSGAPVGASGGSGAFRKVDVDSYDENRFQEENTDDSASALNESEIGALINQWDAFLLLLLLFICTVYVHCFHHMCSASASITCALSQCVQYTHCAAYLWFQGQSSRRVEATVGWSSGERH